MSSLYYYYSRFPLRLSWLSFNSIIQYFFRVAQRREEAVSREMMKKFADDKKMTKKEKDERCGVKFVF